MDHRKLEICAGQMGMHTVMDMLYAIYCKSITLQNVCEKLTHQKVGSSSADNEEMMKLLHRSAQEVTKKRQPSKYGITVAGIDSMVITLAPCCQPIPP